MVDKTPNLGFTKNFIENFDFGYVIGRAIKTGMPPQVAPQALAEFKEFLFAHAAHPNIPLVPQSCWCDEFWHEFIVAEPDAKTMNDLIKTYLAPRGGKPGLLLRPVLRKILSHKLMFESIKEPNMVKPPVVFVAGMYRAMGVGIKDQTAFDYLDAMGQLPYNPPNVSGWEGGLSWLTTNTVLSRFALAGELMDRKAPADKPGESSSQAVARALREVGRPWLAKGSVAAIKDYAARAPSGRNDLRIERQRMIRALALAGPDAQVM